jgi:hypothetical protein
MSSPSVVGLKVVMVARNLRASITRRSWTRSQLVLR